MKNYSDYLNSFGIHNVASLHSNLAVPVLLEKALEKGEGKFALNGAFVVATGERTGRSPLDRYVVEEETSKNNIDWGEVNRPIAEKTYYHILNKVAAFYQGKELFVQDVYAGAAKEYRMPVRVISHKAWAAVFANTLFIRPESETELQNFEPGFTVIHAPELFLNPKEDGVRSHVAVLVNFKEKTVIIAGTGYAGEIKKSIFSVMNYYLPLKGVLSMHCSANVGTGGDTALFFGLSGTGKTSLSADPDRMLIGDDEHGWSEDKVFNFEGGCYAKVINLSEEKEPQIYNAIRFGSIAENVIMDPDTRSIDYDAGDITENTRATYPVEYIDNALISGVGNIPKNILFLTADAFGVLPPIAKLDKNMAMYHFLSGYTSKLAGTEAGVTEPEATFSACFGSPFLPLHPSRYAEMLGEKMEKYDVNVWLINTGWTGGPYGVGKRMDIRYTRAMVKAALSGALNGVDFKPHPVFKVLMPVSCPEVPGEVLDPVNTWKNKDDYQIQAKKLAGLFRKNIEKFLNVDIAVKNAGPHI